VPKILSHNYDSSNRSGFINVHEVKNFDNLKRIYSNSNFFENEVLINVEADKIIISKPDLDNTEKTYKLTKAKNTLGCFHSRVCLDIPAGTYYFDELESDEDKVIIYIK